jgi:hypothetical protein
VKQPQVVVLHELPLLDNVVLLRCLRRCMPKQRRTPQCIARAFQAIGGCCAVAKGVGGDSDANALMCQRCDDPPQYLIAYRIAAVADPKARRLIRLECARRNAGRATMRYW